MSEACPVVLIPGSLCDARLFAPQISFFSSRYRVIVPDISGCDTFTQVAQKILRQLEGEVSLAGLSMGGIISLEIMRQAPQRVQRLALLNSNPNAEFAEKIPLRERQIARVQRGGVSTLLALTADELFPGYLSPSCLRAEQIKQVVLAMAESTGVQGFTEQWLSHCSRIDSRPFLSAIQCPTLILCGEDDTITPPQLHLDISAEIAQGSLKIIPRCGHLSTLEQPDAVNHALSDWLEK